MKPALPSSSSFWIRIAAILLCTAVLLGAFGAHVLRPIVTPDRLAIFEKAVLYHFVHALGIILVAVMSTIGLVPIKRAAQLCALLTFGIVIFSGSLYGLVLTKIGLFGAITPIGGLAFIGSWAWLAVSITREKDPKRE